MKTETLIITSILVLQILVLPKKWFLFPFILAACMIPTDQRIIIADLDFTSLRFCVLFGFMRLFMRGEVVSLNWNIFDKLILAWSISGAIIYILQWHEMRAVIYKSGVLFDCLGLYWLFRQSLRSWRDVDFVFKVFASFAMISALLIIHERITQKSIFSIMGYVDGRFHHGRYRCAGPFPCFIMMGLFWSTLIPFFIANVFAGHKKFFYITATFCSLICVFLSASSTPFVTVLMISVFFALYKYRAYGKAITFGVCGVLFALHLVMKAPVWHLISRINIFEGSTGWHRYHLIDQAINHFGEWAFLGCRSTAHWGWGLLDITNQYILEGVRGGFVTLLIFIVLMVLAVKIPGSFSLKTQQILPRWISWGVCVSIFGHCVSFFGVSYFGQIKMLLYLTFAAVGFINELACKNAFLVSIDQLHTQANRSSLISNQNASF